MASGRAGVGTGVGRPLPQRGSGGVTSGKNFQFYFTVDEFWCIEVQKISLFWRVTTSVNWDFGRGPEYESSLDPQARELVGYCMDMASEEVGFGRSEGTCNGSPLPKIII